MSSYMTLFDLIGQLARQRYQAAERRFGAIGLNHTEARLLTLLDEMGSAASQDDLSGRLSIDRSNAGRALKRLEAGGHIARRKDATDKRAKQVTLSETGRAKLADIAAIKADIVQESFGKLTEAEAKTAAVLLEKAMAPDA